MAANAEEKKCEKYSHLVPNYIFQPVVMETSGLISLSFLRALRRSCLAQESGKANSTAYLLQSLSIAECSGHPGLCQQLITLTDQFYFVLLALFFHYLNITLLYLSFIIYCFMFVLKSLVASLNYYRNSLVRCYTLHIQ